MTRADTARVHVRAPLLLSVLPKSAVIRGHERSRRIRLNDP